MTSCAVSLLFKKFWAWRLKEFPEFATFCGVHDYDGELQSYALQAIQQRMGTVEEFLNEASKLTSEPTLSDDNKLSLQYFIYELKTFCEGCKYKGYYFPICYLDGVHIEFERLLDSMKKDSENDYEKIVIRISCLPCQISEIMALMREGIKNKMTFHEVSVTGVLKQLDLLAVPPKESFLYKPFECLPDSISSSFKEDVQSRAVKVIEEALLSFYQLKEFVEKDYLKHCRPDIAISSLPGGEKFYQGCLDFHLSCSMTPEEVHKVGLDEVEQIKQKMEKVIESLDLKMSLKEFFKHIQGNDEFFYENEEDLINSYKNTLFSLIEPKLPKIFNYKPRIEILVKPNPASKANAPAAYYYAGTLDRKPGTFYVNTTKLNALPSYDVRTLALHEGLPGHHFQFSYLIEDDSLPDFRRFLEDRRYSESPTLFPFYTAYVEGWGLYSEHLGYELGLYDDPYMEFGHLSCEMMRACRLVVDTGMHVFGWSKDQAIQYMMDHIANDKFEIENEINRYITWPGQACGYKIGELKIKLLRQKVEESLGSKFNLSKFHDLILQSYGPLEIMEDRVLQFIENEDV